MALAYRELVNQTRTLIGAIGQCDSKTSDILRSLEAIQKEKDNWTSVNLDDPEAVRKISDARVREELLPKQLEGIDADKARFIYELQRGLGSLESEIANLRAAERDRLISQISLELSKKYCGGNHDAGKSVAASLPIVTVIELNSSWTSPKLGADRAINPKSHDEEVLSHANQLLSILDRYQANDCSFIPPTFKKAA